MTLPLVLVMEPMDADSLAWLARHARVLQASTAQPDGVDALAAADGLLVRTYTRVDDALLDRAPRLKVVGRAGVGLENIDVAACRRRGIEVVHTPDANTQAVAEFVFGLVLQLVRPWCPFREHPYAPDEFKRLRDAVCGSQLDELTLGVLGMGRIGRRVGRIAAAGFGMRVLYHDLVDVTAQLEGPAQSVDLETLLVRSDVLSVHVDLRPGNHGLLSRDRLARMKPTAVLINTSRGEVIDTPALADALAAGRLAGAALDVFAPEPPGPDLPVLGLEHVLLTPHLAARTQTAIANMGRVVRDVAAVLAGRTARYPAPAVPDE